jgi:hypothetical protein
MSKSAEERMMQKEFIQASLKGQKTIIFCGVYLLVIKWQTKHKLGDMITIKSIIENQAIVLINILKNQKNFDKANLKPEQ